MEKNPKLPERKPRPSKGLEAALGGPVDEAGERKELGNTVVRLGKKWRGEQIKNVPLKSLVWLAGKWEPSDFWEAQTLKAIRKYIRLPVISRMIEKELGDERESGH